MDLVAGGVVHGRLPVRPSRFPLLLGSLPYTTVAVSAAFSGCPCPPIVRRNAPAVVPFAKKKRKGYSEDPPDEEVADDFTDELEEDEEVEEEEDFGAEEEEEGDFVNSVMFVFPLMMVGSFRLCFCGTTADCGPCILLHFLVPLI
jgi:hypothetical protein